MSLIEHIDAALQKYYNSFEHLKPINSYVNDDDIGKFSLFCSENGLDDSDLESEIEYGAEDCLLIDFDLDDNGNHLFPFNKPFTDKEQQNKEIFRIIKNMFIDASTPSTQPPKSNFLFSDEQFVYTQNRPQNTDDRDDVVLLLFGYVRRMESQFALDDYVGGIPSVLIHIMTFFYGKKYLIHGSPPKDDEYDYAMEILSPIHRIGILHRKSRIVSLSSQRSRNNIIYGSHMIQINDYAITPETEGKVIDKALALAKAITPSYIVFRCRKDAKQKGTHLQYNVSFGAGCDGDKFPYYKFTKPVVQGAADEIFGAFGKVEIMEIYANKTMCNGAMGSYGVSIFIFIENAHKLFRSYEVYEAATAIEELIQERIHAALRVRFYSKMEGIKANGIDCGWKRAEDQLMVMYKPLHDLCVLVHENGFYDDSYYFVMVDIERIDMFHIPQRRTILSMTHQGHILFSSFILPPFPGTRQKILSDYRFYSNLK